MAKFTEKQIQNFKKAQLEVLSKLELFELGIIFTKENYIVRAPIFSLREFNTDWLVFLREAITDIDFENDEIAGIKIKNDLNKLEAIVKYIGNINQIMYTEFNHNISQIDKILSDFEIEVSLLLQ